MNYGPHIYNSLSPEAQREQLRRKQAKIEKKTHRIRLNRIVAIFAIIFVVLGVQIAIRVSQTARINNQVKAEKENLTKVKKTANNLKTKRQNLNDPNYVAKLIRYKFYYSKSNENIYNVHERNDND
ncbi:FtsB family cell division protein [Lactobacillus helveticus]|jgi:cell division protein DivIC|uniref:Cell division protein FtsL n=1 Tax=Lactobacillus helveticus TaxID=1587 RepID=A0A3S8SE67_LACHE|nr:septum formation initiator family protein [Lactobacillus helveticus]AFR21312.1 septum formation initiator [Lactobacillus helveticus R0052]AZK92020.1 Cell division protein FtsL [Lactobacillus helveticus]MCJ2190036.1 septum formation initiator family protein [Lactobacillus helveticus]MED7628100.1 septum formation initiator family protein [Lactobacillus helveticus]MZR05631.1 septum formation initiator family protein [Lactobacillus helveticus]